MKLSPFFAPDPIVHEIPDLLHKESEFLDKLSKFLAESITPPFSLSINGSWGAGKTMIMKSLQKRLEEDGYPVLWFNPWEYERTEEIVHCFLIELTRFAKSRLGELSKELGIFALSLATAAADLTAKLISGGKLSYANVSKIEQDIREALTGRYDKENPVEIIKKDFAKLTQEIAKKGGENEPEKPLIVFFDDLDRCLPENALELLEALKNLFVVPNANVIFISGIDTQVAKEFISERYKGLDSDYAHNYFKKIFHFTINVPTLTEQNFEKLIQDRFDHLFQKDPFADTKEYNDLISDFSRIVTEAGIKSIRPVHNIINQFYFLRHMNSGSMDTHNFGIENINRFYLLFFTLKECWPDYIDELIRIANQLSLKVLGEIQDKAKDKVDEKNRFQKVMTEKLQEFRSISCKHLLEM